MLTPSTAGVSGPWARCEETTRSGGGTAVAFEIPMAAKSKKPAGPRAVATNRQARRDYEILDTYEAGIMLQGSEVKSLREANVQLAEAFARFDGHEIFLVGLHIAAYSHSGQSDGHLADRQRKLLLHRNEIDRIRARVDIERLTLVPLS